MENETVGDIDVSSRRKMKGLYAPDEHHSFIQSINQSTNQLAFVQPLCLVYSFLHRLLDKWHPQPAPDTKDLRLVPIPDLSRRKGITLKKSDGF